MKPSDWDRKYRERPRVWGEEPNRLVAAELHDLHPGRALDLACGEGRNAIWLAQRGWSVLGVDFSEVAVARGIERAARLGVEIDLRVGDVLTADLDTGTSDLVLISYLQLPADERHRLLERAVAALAPGGVLFLVAHDLRNLAEGTGGPSDPAVLWTAPETAGRLEAAGLEIAHAGVSFRPVDGAERPAVDTVVRAHWPLTGTRAPR